ncbi:MAG: putative sulfate exporter family transporter [Cloacibacterium sp.]|nr:putative sulfate exporter family transporter [Cloacibacterium sp.]
MFQNKNSLKILFIILAALCFFPVVSPPIALFLGIIFVNIFGQVFNADKIIKIVLQVSIVGLGFGINLKQALQAGSEGFLFTVFSITLIVVLGIALGYIFRIDKIITQLISFGTAICGGSAIAAIAPILKADGKQTSVSLGIIFLLNALALFIFPEIGQYFNLSQYQFGIWSAIAIHDTSSVVGAASKYGHEALQTATTVKLARALWIIPISFMLSFLNKSGGKIKIPYFIGFFVLAILVNSYFPAIKEVTDYVVDFSKSSLKVALFLIGTGLSFQNLKNIGIKPLLLGIILWVVISVISLFAVLEFLK